MRIIRSNIMNDLLAVLFSGRDEKLDSFLMFLSPSCSAKKIYITMRILRDGWWLFRGERRVQKTSADFTLFFYNNGKRNTFCWTAVDSLQRLNSMSAWYRIEIQNSKSLFYSLYCFVTMKSHTQGFFYKHDRSRADPTEKHKLHASILKILLKSC